MSIDFAPSPHFSALVNAASEAKVAAVTPRGTPAPTPSPKMTALKLDGEATPSTNTKQNRPVKRAKPAAKKKTVILIKRSTFH